MKAPIAGGAKVVLASGEAVNGIRGIAVDSTSVYWANPGPSTSGSIMKVPLDGGTAVSMAAVSGPQFLVVSGGMLYFTCWEPKAGVEKISTSGGSVSVVWPKPVDQWARIAVDSKSVYLAQGSADNVLVQIDINTGTATTFTAPAFGVALDDSNVFWVGQNGINFFPKAP